MNKDTVKNNLIFVFLKEKEWKKALKIRIDAQDLEYKTIESVKEARIFLRKSIQDIKEVYFANIDGKNYKIKPDENNEFDIVIKEIKIIY